jgi:hypothetical protein
MHCPHCENTIVPPNENWDVWSPWSCSHCGGLYGVRWDRERTYPIPSDAKPLAPLLNWDAAQTFCFYSKKLYYVYALCYPTGLPFYVGMGNNKRCFQHLNESKIWQANARWNEKNDIIYQLHSNERIRLVSLSRLGT